MKQAESSSNVLGERVDERRRAEEAGERDEEETVVPAGASGRRRRVFTRARPRNCPECLWPQHVKMRVSHPSNVADAGLNMLILVSWASMASNRQSVAGEKKPPLQALTLAYPSPSSPARQDPPRDGKYPQSEPYVSSGEGYVRTLRTAA